MSTETAGIGGGMITTEGERTTGTIAAEMTIGGTVAGRTGMTAAGGITGERIGEIIAVEKTEKTGIFTATVTTAAVIMTETSAGVGRGTTHAEGTATGGTIMTEGGMITEEGTTTITTGPETPVEGTTRTTESREKTEVILVLAGMTVPGIERRRNVHMTRLLA